MGYQGWFFSVFYVLTGLVCLSVSQPNFTEYFCSNGLGNYTANSTYQANLNSLLSSLSSNINQYGFYNSSSGQDPDRVNAIVLCRGDVDHETCRVCVDNSAKKLTQVCPNQMEAIGWYDECMLRYSNKSIFGIMTTAPAFSLRSPLNSSNVNLFSQEVSELATSLEKKVFSANPGRKFAVEKSNNSNIETIYALMQCTPDIDSGTCDFCLRWASSMMSQCCSWNQGARFIGPSCSFWFELFPFYNESAILSPPPPPPPPPPLLPSPPSPQSIPSPQGKKGNNKTWIIVVGVIVPAVLVLLAIGIFIARRKWQKRRKGVGFEDLEEIDAAETEQYDFGTIRAATNNFAATNLLGKGGFGVVYKGTLSDGKNIAVKRLSKDSVQGEQEFRNEVLLVAKLQHKSLVKLLGFCLEKTERLLAYEFMSNGSLDQFLFDPVRGSQLDWDRRYKIIESVAKGLLYLHEDSRLKIIHRDLKASNVLLDDEMNAKISDFGLAKLFLVDESVANTNRIVGTYGYMAPESALHGLFSIKSDVFSYGVLVLEIISGQKNCYVRDGQTVEDLLSIAWKNWLKGTAPNIIDPTLKAGSGSIQNIVRCIHIGLLCVQDNVASRPTMASVVLMLQSFSVSLPKPSEPAFFTNSSSIGSEKSDEPLFFEDSKTRSPAGQPQPAVATLSVNEASISELDPR